MIRVIKVGGSLFDLADLRQRIGLVISELAPATNVLIAGGGRYADLIEEAQKLHQFGDEKAHWLCIKAMSVTALELQVILQSSKAILSNRIQQIAEDTAQSLWVFDAYEILQSANTCQTVRKLPRDWRVSSDSIAAAVAAELLAEELVLLKSAPWPFNNVEVKRMHALQSAATQGMVDEYLATAAESIPRFGWLNLRCRSPTCKWIGK